jgi:thioesterase domain-containing protein/acyl carrier protein
VIVREDGGAEKQLVAYVVASEGANLEVSELRRSLREQLPDYMIPAAFVLLDELPLTANGKLDRRALTDSLGCLGFESASVAPRDALELQLVQVWEEILDARPIGITDNFFELGGHSLIALRLMAKIQKRFRRELPLSSLFHGATIEHLARLLRQDNPSLPWSTLVAIQPRGSKPPFFCIHPIGGDVLCYYHLAQHMGVDQPVYALQAHNLAEESDRYVSIEELAAQYLETMRGVQAEGPYFLGGWSFGGVVAFEMAQLLSRQGESVRLLALFDTWSPKKLPKVNDKMLLAALAKDYARANGKALTVPMEALEKKTGDEQLDYVLNLLKETKLVSAELDLGWFGRYFKGWKARNQAIHNFVPQSYDGPISLYRAVEADGETLKAVAELGVDLEEPTLGWAELCTQPVHVQMVAGYHETILDEPHVQNLARQLKNRIEETTEVERI